LKTTLEPGKSRCPIENNEAGVDEACSAALAISILEWLAEKDSGLTPCSDSLAQNQSLKEKLSFAVENTRSAETKLRISFASHGYTDQQPAPGNASSAVNAM
jgi:hypothetical protein